MVKMADAIGFAEILEKLHRINSAQGGNICNNNVLNLFVTHF